VFRSRIYSLYSVKINVCGKSPLKTWKPIVCMLKMITLFGDNKLQIFRKRSLELLKVLHFPAVPDVIMRQ